MLNINKYIADALAAGGVELPACEEPMLRVESGHYITWEQGHVDTLRASGEPYEQRCRVMVNLWLTADELDGHAWLSRIQRALALYDGIPGVSCYIGDSQGARDVPQMNRKLVQMEVQIVDRMWSR